MILAKFPASKLQYLIFLNNDQYYDGIDVKMCIFTTKILINGPLTSVL